MEWERVSHNTFVKVEEMPNGRLSIQGLRDGGELHEPHRYAICGNIWSLPAVKAIHRLTGEWLKSKEEGT